MATMTELLEQTRSRLDEASAGFWTESQLRIWIMEGARDIARRAEVLQTTGTVAGVAGTQTYTCPTDVIRVYRAEWKNTGDTFVYPLDYQDYNNMDQVWWTGKTQGTNVPSFFTFWGYPPTLSVTLYPTPSQAGTLTLYYYKMPTPISSTGSGDASTVETPMGWEDLITLYCEYNALRKDASNRWSEAKTIYEEKLDEMIQVTRRWSDQSGMIVSAANPSIPSWIYTDDF